MIRNAVHFFNLNKPMEHNRKMQHNGHLPMDMRGHYHHAMMIADFKKRFYTVLILTVPILLLSATIQQLMGVNWRFAGSSYILFALSSIVFIYGGWPFLTGLVKEVNDKNPGMMFLIGFAITVAYGHSAAIVFGLKGMDFFWEMDTLILIMLLGHWIEMKSVADASNKLELLAQLIPAEAHLVMPNKIRDVKTDLIKEKDIILVNPGEKVAADGIILEGESYLNERMLTGESKPVQKTKGDKVIAGAINGNGSFKVAVTHAAKDTHLSQMIKLIDEDQKSKSKTRLLANTAARWLTIIALITGIATFLYWYLTGQHLSFAMDRMVTVIVICCPHALGLAVPLVIAKSTALSAKHSPLIKNRPASENARKITTIVLDRTGKLTVGKFNNAKDIASLVRFGKATYRKMVQNLAWATGYNIVALPLAAGILYNRGVLLSPAAVAVMMTVSTVMVAINASLLKVKN